MENSILYQALSINTRMDEWVQVKKYILIYAEVEQLLVFILFKLVPYWIPHI